MKAKDLKLKPNDIILLARATSYMEDSGDLSIIKMSYRDFLRVQKLLKAEEKDNSLDEDEEEELSQLLSEQDEIKKKARCIIPLESYYGSYAHNKYGRIILL